MMVEYVAFGGVGLLEAADVRSRGAEHGTARGGVLFDNGRMRGPGARDNCHAKQLIYPVIILSFLFAVMAVSPRPTQILLSRATPAGTGG